MTVLLYKKLLDTRGSFCLEKRWMRRMWQVSLRFQVAGRTRLHSSCISSQRAGSLGMNPARGTLCWGWAVETPDSSWFISRLYFHTESVCACSYLSPQCLGRGFHACALGTPAGIASIGRNINILINTSDKPTLLAQMGSTAFTALNISHDLDLKAKWPVCKEMSDWDNSKGTNKIPHVRAGSKVILAFIILMSLLLLQWTQVVSECWHLEKF